jgi:hypothetical protein
MQTRRFIAPLAVLLGLTLFSVFLTLIQAQTDPPLPLPLNDTAASLHTRATVELLSNPSFETNTDGDNIPDGWTGKKTSVSKADKQKCNKTGKVFANTGNCAFMFKGNPGGEKSKLNATLTNLTSIVDGSTLRLSAYLDPRSGVPSSKVASVKLKLTNGTKLKLELRLPSSAVSNGYAQLIDSQSVVIPNGVLISKSKMDLRYGETSGKFLVDDVSLAVVTIDPTHTPVDTATSTSIAIPTNTPTPTHTPKPLPPAQLLASEGAEEDQFGDAVSLSGDGNTALVGAPRTDIGTKIDVGVAHLFARTDTTWAKWQFLTFPVGAAQDYFGSAVSLSADGSTALVGASSDDVGTKIDQGSAYVFIRLGGIWLPQQQLVASDGLSFDYFGSAVSLSADGNTALVGAAFDHIGANNYQGSVYIFVRTGTTWTQQQKLLASDGAAQDYFGWSVSLSADGSIALVGAYRDDVGATDDQGSAYVFIRSGTIWTQQQQLIASDGATGDYFGRSVSLSANGNTALVGAYRDDVGATDDQGSAYGFTRSGTIWTQKRKHLASDGAADDYFGYSVSLSADGSTALVGASEDNIGAHPDQGSAWVFDLKQ